MKKMSRILLKELLFWGLLTFSLHALHAQQARTIKINPVDTVALNLSEIAESVVPVTLSQSIVEGIEAVYTTDEYLYVYSRKSIFQFDLLGNIVNIVLLDKNVSDMTVDNVSNDIYVASVDNRIVCYDAMLKMKKTCRIQHSPSKIFYYKDKLWIESSIADSGVCVHKISKLDLATCQEQFLPFEYEAVFSEFKETGVTIRTECYFSVYKERLFFALSIDSILYEIKNNTVVPFISLNVLSTASDLYTPFPVMMDKRITGRYLFANYMTKNKSGNSRNRNNYLYIEDMITGKKYNVKKQTGFETGGYAIFDDIYNTGYIFMRICNQAGDFCFIKERESVHNVGDTIETYSRPVIFIVKPKSSTSPEIFPNIE